MSRGIVVALLLACVMTASASASSARTAPATAPVPSPGQVYTGVSVGSASGFESAVGKHAAIYGEFVTWGQSIHFAFAAAASAHAALMLHISTAEGYGARQVITPAGIARGDGDAYLVSLGQLIASYHHPVYIRLLPEMDQANNGYCGFNADGSSRGPQYAPSAFVAAWRRAVLVLRGGSVAGIDAQLRTLGMPDVQGVARTQSLATPVVSFVWTPQVAGSPDIAANSPAAYYPGDQYVDWVGTDFYSRFPNFAGLSAFYAQYPQKPFAFGEWAIWGADNPSWVDQLFGWIDSHKRVQMTLYNQGYGADSPFALHQYPASADAIRSELASPRFLSYTPDWLGQQGRALQRGQ